MEKLSDFRKRTEAWGEEEKLKNRLFSVARIVFAYN